MNPTLKHLCAFLAASRSVSCAALMASAEDGFCVYGYYLFGQFYISGSTNPLFPDPENAQGHITEEIPDSDGILLAKENLPEAYRNMFTRYTEKGEARWSTDLSDH